MSAFAGSNWSNDRASPEGAATGPAISTVFLLGAVGVVFGFAVWHATLITRAVDRAPHNDFGRFYLSVCAFVAGGDMYAWNEAIPARLPSLIDLEVHEIDLWNMNPPHFHLLILPLAPLPAGIALIAWTACGVIALCVSLRMIRRELQLDAHPDLRHIMAIALLAGVATAVTVVTGQVSWFLMLLVTLVWVHARRGNWVVAGAWLGVAAAWKPFLLIFLPYLVLQRQWRALGAVAATAALSYAVGLAVFGVDTHVSWMRCIGESGNWAWLHINASLWGFLSRAASPNPLYVPLFDVSPGVLKTVWLLAAGAIGAATVAVAITDRSAVRLDRAFAMHLTASFLICPLGWNYYWLLAVGPVVAVALHCELFQGSSGTGRFQQFQRLMLLFAIFAWFAPAYITQYVPGRFMTVTVGSVYFWGTFCLWLALVCDAWRHLERPRSWRDLFAKMLPPADSNRHDVCCGAT